MINLENMSVPESGSNSVVLPPINTEHKPDSSPSPRYTSTETDLLGSSNTSTRTVDFKVSSVDFIPENPPVLFKKEVTDQLEQLIAKVTDCHNELVGVEQVHPIDLVALNKAVKAYFTISSVAKCKTKKIFSAVLERFYELDWIHLFKRLIRYLHETFADLMTTDIKVFSWFPKSLGSKDYHTSLYCALVAMRNILSQICRFTNYHKKSALDFCSEGLLDDFVEIFISKLSTMDWEKECPPQKILQTAMMGIYNSSRFTANHSYYKKHNLVEVLVPSLKKGLNKKEIILQVNVLSLLTVAYLIEEKDNHLLITDNGPILFLIDCISRALEVSKHSYNGFSAEESAMGLKQIASNDDIKQIVGENNGVFVLSDLLCKAKNDDEKIAACRALWSLSFHEKNKERILTNTLLINLLEQIKKDESNTEISKAAVGILWEVRDKNKQKETSGHAGKHIMISYQWNYQAKVIEIRNKLRDNGYKVWLDIDNIGGSTIEAMALAVEQSNSVIICISRDYKSSPNCRSEAEYAFQLRKTIVPLKVESGYSPDGWLGILVGTRLWFNFYDESKFHSSLSQLVTELKRTNEVVFGTDSDEGIVAVSKLNEPEKYNAISHWTRTDVRKWLFDANLLNLMEKDMVDRLNGKYLISLHHLSQQDPTFYHNSLKADFGLPDVLTIIDFNNALRLLFDRHS